MKRVMNKELKLSGREWREFQLGCDEFVVSGTTTTPPLDLIAGGYTPRITCAATDNGYDDSYTNAPTEKGGVLTIDSATIGYVSYQGADFIATDHVEKLSLSKVKMERYIGLFLKVCIDKACQGKYGYGYKFSQRRIRRQIILLPVQSDGTPDWEFMSAYMKQEEEGGIASARRRLEEQLLENIVLLGALNDREWREFFFSDIFTSIQRGKRLKKDDHRPGGMPYVSSSANNNGIDGFIGNTDGVRIFEDCISLANSGSVGSAFFQAYAFVASDHVTKLERTGLDRYAYLFLLPIISRLSEKYSFNREINDTRLSRERLLLPVQSDGTPDWEFMSAFMQRVEHETLSKALAFFRPKECDNMLMGGGRMLPFYIGHVLSIENGVRLTKADMREGIRPFIGASESNNGVTGFIDNTNSSLASNVLGVNYNGSVGFSFYHPYKALFSDDVKRVRWKDEEANNKYTLLYLSTAISQQKGKYAYGYKFNAQRMKRQLILLPVLDDGTLDYALMEHTMRLMEYEALRKYMSEIAV